MVGSLLRSGYALPAQRPDHGLLRNQPAGDPLIDGETLSRPSRPPLRKISQKTERRPLLERYLRQKAALTSDTILSDGYVTNFAGSFQRCDRGPKPKSFGGVSKRHTPPSGVFEPNKKRNRTTCGRSDWRPARHILHPPDRGILLNPEDFVTHITQQIKADFSTFEGAGSSAPPLVVEWTSPVAYTGEPAFSIRATTAPVMSYSTEGR